MGQPEPTSIPAPEPVGVEGEEPTEVVTGELTNDSTEDRTVRVYAGQDGEDFILTLPPGCRYGNQRENIGRATALRVYQGSGQGNQLAAFLGVKGFRDQTIKLQKLVERVTIERRVVDDGEGTVEYEGKNQRELKAIQENSEF